MGIGSGTAMLIGGLASAGGSVASGIMGGNAAKSAAGAQAQAAEQAAQLQYQESQNALDFQKQQWGTAQNELMPFLNSGVGALSNLNYLMGVTPGGFTAPTAGPSVGGDGAALPPYNGSSGSAPVLPRGPGATLQPTPLSGVRPASGVRLTPGGLMPGTSGATPIGANGTLGAPTAAQPAGAPAAPSVPGGGFGSLMQPYGKTFSAPTLEDMEQNDPGYQARLKLGQQAFEQSAAARGNLLTGGTAQAENQLAQDYASNEYNNFYNQAFNTFGENYNQYAQNQANQFNRLAAMAGMGQTTAGQLGTLGQSAANAVSNNLLSTGQMMGNDYQNAAAANATGMYNSANAYGGMASGIGNSIGGMMNLSMLQNLLNRGTGYTPTGNELTDMGI